MEEATARELTTLWIDKVPLDPDTQAGEIAQLRHAMPVALQGLVPEAVEAAVIPGDDGPWPEVLAVDAQSLIRVMFGEEDGGDGWGLVAESYRLDRATHATVVERLAMFRGREQRVRAWQFDISGFPFKLLTEEAAGGGSEPGREERFARALARALGWAVPSNAGGAASWRPM